MEITERQTQMKIWRRVMPLVLTLNFFCGLDRMNIGFAALQMNAYLGLSNAEFGKAAGSFVIGYSLLVIPSALLMNRLGIRRGISLIALLWALCSAATAFVRTPNELIAARVLLGAAEAGFMPAMTLYLGYWFPSEYRGRALASFFLVGPLLLIIGGPLSSVLLVNCDGLLGLAGWQWLFVLEALPALMLVPLAFLTLNDGPADAPWLSPQEKERLIGRIAAEKKQGEGSQANHSTWRALASGRVWQLAMVHFCLGISVTGFSTFLPLMIRAMEFSAFETGFIVAAPAFAAFVLMPLWGVWTDRSRNRVLVVAATCWTMAAGLLGMAVLLPSPWALIPISLVLVGHFGHIPSFWTLPLAFLTGAGAAAGMGLIVAMGHLAALIGPPLVGWTKDLTGFFSAGMVLLASFAAVSAVILTIEGMRNRNSINRKAAAARAAGV